MTTPTTPQPTDVPLEQFLLDNGLVQTLDDLAYARSFHLRETPRQHFDDAAREEITQRTPVHRQAYLDYYELMKNKYDTRTFTV